jgi:hypothetical protein
VAVSLYAELLYLSGRNQQNRKGEWFRVYFRTLAGYVGCTPRALMKASERLRLVGLVVRRRTGRSNLWRVVPRDQIAWVPGVAQVHFEFTSSSLRNTVLEFLQDQIKTTAAPDGAHAAVSAQAEKKGGQKQQVGKKRTRRNPDMQLDEAIHHPLITGQQEQEGAYHLSTRPEARAAVEELLDLGLAPQQGLQGWRELLIYTGELGLEGLKALAAYTRLKGPDNPGAYIASLIRRQTDVRPSLAAARRKDRQGTYQPLAPDQIQAPDPGAPVYRRPAGW